MKIITLTSSDKMWDKVKKYAQNCSWRAGKSLADKMNNDFFTECKYGFCVTDRIIAPWGEEEKIYMQLL